MAQYNSVLLGKSIGSVGNLTTTSIKGQKILKQKIPKRNFVPSQAQTAQRIKLMNSAAAYTTISVPFQYAGNMKLIHESYPNEFSRLFTPYLSSTLYASNNSWVVDLANKPQIYLGNYVTIHSLSNNYPVCYTVIYTNGFEWHSGIFLVYCMFDGSSNKMLWNRIEIPFEAWGSPSWQIQGLDIYDWWGFSWVYDSKSKKMSNIFIH
jgi:hypothetical protein